MLVGTEGMLIAGPRAEALEPVAADYARLRCRLDFCHVIHARLQQVSVVSARECMRIYLFAQAAKSQ